MVGAGAGRCGGWVVGVRGAVIPPADVPGAPSGSAPGRQGRTSAGRSILPPWGDPAPLTGGTTTDGMTAGSAVGWWSGALATAGERRRACRSPSYGRRCVGFPLDSCAVCRAGRRVDLLLVFRPKPRPAVELLPQDVNVTGMPSGLLKNVDHDAKQLNVGLWPPRHVTGRVDGKRSDRRVRMPPNTLVEVDDLIA